MSMYAIIHEVLMKKVNLVIILMLIALLGLSCEANAKTKVKQTKGHVLKGKASWYGGKFHGRKTASGAIYNKYTHTAAHKTLPFGTVVEVTDQKNSRRTLVCITDRGPFVRGRVIDLSKTAADELDIGNKGITAVKLRVVSDVHGKTLNDNEAFFVLVHSMNKDKKEKVGPFQQFGDASVMKEVLKDEHPEASIIVASKN